MQNLIGSFLPEFRWKCNVISILARRWRKKGRSRAGMGADGDVGSVEGQDVAGVEAEAAGGVPFRAVAPLPVVHGEARGIQW